MNLEVLNYLLVQIVMCICMYTHVHAHARVHTYIHKINILEPVFIIKVVLLIKHLILIHFRDRRIRKIQEILSRLCPAFKKNC